MEAYNNGPGSPSRGVTNAKSAAAKYRKRRHPNGPQPSDLADRMQKQYTPRAKRKGR